MTRPEILDKYIIGKGDDKIFKTNDTTNAWMAAYKILRGVYTYGMKRGQLEIQKELERELARDKAAESSKEEKSEYESNYSKDRDSKLIETTHMLQSAQKEATNIFYPITGEIIQQATEPIKWKRNTILKEKIPEMKAEEWKEQGEEVAEELITY